MTTVEKIFTLIKKSGKTEYQIKKDTGLPNSIFSEWRAGRAKPSVNALIILSNYFNVSVDYLLGREDQLSREKFPSADIVRFPVRFTVAAGFDQAISEDYDGEIQEVPTSIIKGYSADDLFVFGVSGDSMFPKFLDGDRVLVLRTASVDSGDIAVIAYSDFEDGTLKKVLYEPHCDYVDLIPLNPAYNPVRIQGDALSGVRIIGKVIYLFRKI